MPRQSRGPAPAPKRPVAAPARPAPPPINPQQSRPASTAAYPPQHHPAAPPAQAAPPASSSGSGLFGQMASTAAGVAVGSSIGHAVGGWFSGGSSAPAAAPATAPPAPLEQQPALQAPGGAAARACATEVDGFRRCMDDHRGDLTVCAWYLDQLKACQSAAAQY